MTCKMREDREGSWHIASPVGLGNRNQNKISEHHKIRENTKKDKVPIENQ